MKELAQDVANKAASEVPKLTGKAAASIKARGNAKGASIAFGGSKAPYYPWLDFGGRIKIGKKGARTGERNREFIKGGRFVYPTIAAEEPVILEKADKLIGDIIRRHGLDTTGGN